MHAYIFVDEHPYYTRTDAQGRFELSQVPPGDYEVVCWMPNWNKARHERDPEAGTIIRWFFGPPLERVQAVSLTPAAIAMVNFPLTGDLFAAADGRPREASVDAATRQAPKAPSKEP
jgi:hypothetical protein